MASYRFGGQGARSNKVSWEMEAKVLAMAEHRINGVKCAEALAVGVARHNEIQQEQGKSAAQPPASFGKWAAALYWGWEQSVVKNFFAKDQRTVELVTELGLTEIVNQFVETPATK